MGSSPEAENSAIRDTDTLLMMRFAGGDEDAFAELFKRNAAHAYRIAARFVGPNDDAQDLVQEAFLRVYLARQRWKPTARFSTWFYRILVNLCLKDLRKRKTAELVSLDSPLPTEQGEVARELPASADAGETNHPLLRKELVEAVRAAVQSLPPDQRMAVILHRFEGLSYKEIAEAMDRSLSSVESLLHRAKQSLRKNLRAWVND